ncbi:MAG: hypothetical protein IID40_02755 [Planctomycetes bacterium]|nr:hypothetical protein [Planctomycetota bacterium]
MSWKTIDRNVTAVDPDAGPVLSEAVRAKIESFFGRYETKRGGADAKIQTIRSEEGFS